MSREIVQIATASQGDDSATIVVLCNDQTMWKIHTHPDAPPSSWIALPPIPQQPGAQRG
ncbi:hypothetical protein [Achromobacter spanius]|nr:hypothetical protein [Achromobacter spanius]